MLLIFKTERMISIVLLLISVQVPDLKQLIFGETEVTDELEAIKWQLLWWTLSIPFDERIQDVPDELKPVVIALMFLRKVKEIFFYILVEMRGVQST